MDFITNVFSQDGVHYLHSAVAALAPFLVGFIWYHKAVFGKIWMADTGMTDEKAKGSNMPLMFGGTMIMNVIIALFLSSLIYAGGGASEGVGAMKLGIGLAVFIVIPLKAIHYLFNMNTFRLWVIDSLHDLVGLALMSLILGLWTP